MTPCGLGCGLSCLGEAQLPHERRSTAASVRVPYSKRGIVCREARETFCVWRFVRVEVRIRIREREQKRSMFDERPVRSVFFCI
jgi:hypothetical protein